MSIENKKFIDVLNYNNNVVAVSGLDGKGYSFAPGTNESPSIIPITLEAITYINSRCDAFKSGILRFRDDEQDELFEYLGIRDEDVIFNDWIEDAIRNPDTDKLTRIINIKNSAQFERVRGAYYSMMNNGEDLSVKVGRLIDARYKELANGKVRSDLVVTSPDGAASNRNDVDVTALKKQVDAQNEQIEKYQKMIDALMAKMGSADTAGADSSDNNADAADTKKTRTAGRKKGTSSAS